MGTISTAPFPVPEIISYFKILLLIVRVSDLMMQRDLLYRYLIIRKIQKIGMMSIIGPIC